LYHKAEQIKESVTSNIFVLPSMLAQV